MDRKNVVELCYKYQFDGSNGVFRWEDQDHLFQGLLMFETFVNDFEVMQRMEHAEELRVNGFTEAADFLISKGMDV